MLENDLPTQNSIDKLNLMDAIQKELPEFEPIPINLEECRFKESFRNHSVPKDFLEIL